MSAALVLWLLIQSLSYADFDDPCGTDPFLVTTDMRNAASDGREWPEPKDPDSPNGA
eukprot:COSAG04_NODE_27147_length_286_cov_0.818182_1_plen_56_part_10